MVKRLVAIVALGLSLTAAAPNAASAMTTSHLSSRFSATNVHVGGRVSILGALTPGTGRVVAVQRYYSRAWHTVAIGRTSSRFTFSVPLSAATRGTYLYRAVGTRTSRYASVIGPALKLSVSGVTRVSLAALASPVLKGARDVLSGSVSGTAPLARPVQLQKLVGSTWVAAANSTSSAGGGFAFALPTATPGAYSYRAYFPAVALATAAVSAARSLTVMPTGPFVLVANDDYQSVTAISLGGGTKIGYHTPQQLSSAFDINAAGQVAAGELSATTGEEQVWVGGTLPRRLVYQVPATRCLSGLQISPNGATVAVFEGPDMGHGYCYGDVMKEINTATASVVGDLARVPADFTQAAVAFSPDGSKLALSWVNSSGGVTIFDTATGAPESPITGVTCSCTQLGDLTGVQDMWWTPRGLVVMADAGAGYGLYSVGEYGAGIIMDSFTGQARSAAVSTDGSSLFWETSNDTAPAVYSTPMHYDNGSSLPATYLGAGTVGTDPDYLAAIANRYLAIDTPDGPSRVVDLTGRQVWSGVGDVGWMN